MLRLVVLLSAVAIALPQTTTRGEKKTVRTNEILAAIRTGRCVVVVVRPAKADSDEAYADWAEYLNDFAARERSVKIVKLSQHRYSELVIAPKLNRPYDTLFLRDKENALLYRGMILEPDVYRAGKAYMIAKSATESGSREGLEEVKVRLRR